ncbi:MAG: helix-turn-helix transcriptional regulator [Vulcanimicrobiaceae bacterium]
MAALTYLRTHRKLWALTQEDLGMLLGRRTSLRRSTIYRLEAGSISPSVRVAFACELLFGKEARQLFPDFYDDLESIIVGRAEQMHRSLGERSDVQSLRKRELLEQIMERVRRGGL